MVAAFRLPYAKSVPAVREVVAKAKADPTLAQGWPSMRHHRDTFTNVLAEETCQQWLRAEWATASAEMGVYGSPRAAQRTEARTLRSKVDIGGGGKVETTARYPGYRRFDITAPRD